MWSGPGSGPVLVSLSPELVLAAVHVGRVRVLVGDQLLGQLVALVEPLRARLHAVLQILELATQQLRGGGGAGCGDVCQK